MPIQIKIFTRIDVKTWLGNGFVIIDGPTDEDFDGDPEINIKIDLPGRKFDTEFKVEIPLASLVKGSPVEVALEAVRKGPDFPFKGAFVSALEGILKAID
jgi:hypothetical protein